MLLYIVYDGIFFFYICVYSKKKCNVRSQDQQFVKKETKKQQKSRTIFS